MWRRVLGITVASSALCAGLGHANSSSTSSSSSSSSSSGEEATFEARFGDIIAFQGDILAFSLDIQPFHGEQSPNYGYVSPLWGDIEPFWGMDIQPFAGDLTGFWGDIIASGYGTEQNSAHLTTIGEFWEAAGPAWGDIYDAWGALRDSSSATGSDWAALEGDFDKIVEQANAIFGEAAEEATGYGISTDKGFLNDLLKEHDIDLDKTDELAEVSNADLSAFFLDFYDGLMSFSGFDAIDHWMPMINWNPALTQDMTYSGDVKVGVLDARVKVDDSEVDYLTFVGGTLARPMAHGAAVASLIAGSHDGEGVMGIAPMADVYVYNPFDHENSATGLDVAIGIRELADEGVSVLNMSLGVPGYTFHQDIATMLALPDLNGVADNLVIVTAAGNEGLAQTQDVVWADHGITTDNLLIVGSVGMSGEISSFSNRPGTACFTDEAGVCGEGDRLMDHFLVAPGEMLLTSDNEGGTMRVSGTSFAAPLVSGTVALIQDYWPWLQDDANAVTKIILNTAQDLGAPGVDEVYGHGLLDVEAAMSPISFDELDIYTGNSEWEMMTPQSLAQAAVDPGQLGLWEAEGASLYAFENVYGNVRDFEIPLSTQLYGQVGMFANYQRHVQRRMMEWAEDTAGNQGFAETETIAGTEDWSLTFTDDVTSETGGMLTFTSEADGLTVIAGLGNGLHGLSSVSTFDRARDYDASRGGANPMLGLASGGSFGSIAKDFANGFTMTFGYSGTAMQQLEVDQMTGVENDGNVMFGRRDARAATAELAYQATEKLRIGAALSGLEEDNSALGSASAGALSMSEDAMTSGLTMTATYALTPRVTLAASATGAHTFATDETDGGLGVASQGLQSSAYQVNADFRALLRKTDRLTLSAAQPLRVERGAMSFTSAQVTDRETGEINLVTDTWDLGTGPRQMAFEADYSIALNDGQMQVGAFSRYDLNDIDIDGRFDAVTVGARFAVTY